jgi:DNA-binding transcriptional LysR family regulator
MSRAGAARFETRAPSRGRTMREFEWNDLRFFLAVARFGTLTAAAQHLHADHTTIGRRVRTLEAALKAKLFDRRTTGYTLTREGERLFKSAVAMEEIAFATQTQLEQADNSLSGTVRIGTTDGFGTIFLAPRIGRLAGAHADLEVQLVAVPRISNLSKREADLAIGLTRPIEGRLYSRKLTDYELGIYGSADYLAKHPPIQSLDDLTAHRFTSYIEDLIYAKELDYIPRVNAAIRPKLKISNPMAQLAATVAGNGLCVIPCFIAHSEPTLMRVLPERVAVINSFWLITHADQRDLARIRAAADFIIDAVKEERDLFLPHAGQHQAS